MAAVQAERERPKAGLSALVLGEVDRADHAYRVAGPVGDHQVVDGVLDHAEHPGGLGRILVDGQDGDRGQG